MIILERTALDRVVDSKKVSRTTVVRVVTPAAARIRRIKPSTARGLATRTNSMYAALPATE